MTQTIKEAELLADFDNGQYTAEDLYARTVIAIADALESVPGALKPGYTDGWTHLFGADSDDMRALFVAYWNWIYEDEDNIGQQLHDAAIKAENNAGPLIYVECDSDTGMTTIWSLAGMSADEIDAWTEARDAR